MRSNRIIFGTFFLVFFFFGVFFVTPLVVVLTVNGPVSSNVTTTTTPPSSSGCASTNCLTGRTIDNSYVNPVAIGGQVSQLGSNDAGTILAIVNWQSTSYQIRVVDAATSVLIYPDFTLTTGGSWTSIDASWALNVFPPWIDSSGRVYAFPVVNDALGQFGIARLTSGGALDTTYGSAGRVTLDAPSAIIGAVDESTGIVAVANYLMAPNTNYAEINIFTGAIINSIAFSTTYTNSYQYSITAVENGFRAGVHYLTTGMYACFMNDVIFFADVSLCTVNDVYVSSFGDVYVTGAYSNNGGVTTQAYAVKLTQGTAIEWISLIPLGATLDSEGRMFVPDTCVSLMVRGGIPDATGTNIFDIDSLTGNITSVSEQYVSGGGDPFVVTKNFYVGWVFGVKRYIC